MKSLIHSQTLTVAPLISNFIPCFTGQVIIYPCWYWSKIMLIKGATGRKSSNTTCEFSRSKWNNKMEHNNIACIVYVIYCMYVCIVVDCPKKRKLSFMLKDIMTKTHETVECMEVPFITRFVASLFCDSLLSLHLVMYFCQGLCHQGYTRL